MLLYNSLKAGSFLRFRILDIQKIQIRLKTGRFSLNSFYRIMPVSSKNVLNSKPFDLLCDQNLYLKTGLFSIQSELYQTFLFSVLDRIWGIFLNLLIRILPAFRFVIILKKGFETKRIENSRISKRTGQAGLLYKTILKLFLKLFCQFYLFDQFFCLYVLSPFWQNFAGGF